MGILNPVFDSRVPQKTLIDATAVLSAAIPVLAGIIRELIRRQSRK